MKLLKRIGFALLIVFIGIQLAPTQLNQSTKVSSVSFINTFEVSENASRILTNSCYSCHSNNTNYPWYSYIQPIGWYINSHIKKAKEELNFSIFGSYSNRKQKSKLKSMVSQIKDGDMPIAAYTLIHSEARLSDNDKKNIIDFLNKTKDNMSK